MTKRLCGKLPWQRPEWQCWTLAIERRLSSTRLRGPEGCGGLSGFSLRAIARRLELSPNTLYTYFPGLDDQITTLLVDTFAGLAATLQRADAAEEPSCTRRSHTLCQADRVWAIAHPSDYDLIFGQPIPTFGRSTPI